MVDCLSVGGGAGDDRLFKCRFQLGVVVLEHPFRCSLVAGTDGSVGGRRNRSTGLVATLWL